MMGKDMMGISKCHVKTGIAGMILSGTETHISVERI